MNLISLPPEVRAIIYDFSFPPAHTQVQLIPYRASLPACHLNLPLPLYRVCKLIYAELPPLAAKLRALDSLYIIRGPFIGPYSNPDDGPRHDDDPDLAHFQSFLRFAERLRLVGPVATTDVSQNSSSKPRKRSIQSSSRKLTAGRECAVRVLEVQPGTWGMRLIVRTVMSCLGPLAVHPDVAARLQVRLIRDEKEGAAEDKQKWAEMEDWLKRYEDLGRGDDVGRRFSASGTSF